MTTGVVVGLLGVLSATAAAWGVGRAWSRLRPSPQPLVECLLGLAGLVSVASAATLVLIRLWSGAWIPRPIGGISDPTFAAALVGTVAGHLSLLAWARATGSGLALAAPPTRWIGLGALSGLGGIGLSLAWVALARGLGLPIVEQDIVADVLVAPEGTGRTLVLLFLVAGAPVLEELVFRGFLQGAVTRALGAHAAIAASALVFGLFHMADPPVVPVLVALGAMFAWLRHRSGSVVPGMLGHVVNNGAALLCALATT